MKMYDIERIGKIISLQEDKYCQKVRGEDKGGP